MRMQIWGGDQRLQACVRKLGVPAQLHPGFHHMGASLGPIADILEEHPPVPVVSLHHLDMVHTPAPVGWRSTGSLTLLCIAWLHACADCLPLACGCNILRLPCKVWSFSSLYHPQVDIATYLEYYHLNISQMAEVMLADEGAFLQQTVCSFERMGSFSISNGFSVSHTNCLRLVADIAIIQEVNWPVSCTVMRMNRDSAHWQPKFSSV